MYSSGTNDFDAEKSITRVTGVGPENRDFFGPVIWQRAKRVLYEPKKGALVMYMSFAVAILGPKKVSIFRAHPFQWHL